MRGTKGLDAAETMFAMADFPEYAVGVVDREDRKSRIALKR